jgi:hypothetical protein
MTTMTDTDAFSTALIRMLQEGTFQQFLECGPGQCAQVEFRLQRSFHIHLTPTTIVVHERDLETIRRHREGRWHALQPTHAAHRRLILDRTTGEILEAPRLGRRHPATSSPAPAGAGNGSRG